MEPRNEHFSMLRKRRVTGVTIAAGVTRLGPQVLVKRPTSGGKEPGFHDHENFACV
jgi:hypothetical protein